MIYYGPENDMDKPYVWAPSSLGGNHQDRGILALCDIKKKLFSG